MPRSTRRLMHWGAVAAVAVAANFGVELAAHRFPGSGFARFVNFTHAGGPPA